MLQATEELASTRPRTGGVEGKAGQTPGQDTTASAALLQGTQGQSGVALPPPGMCEPSGSLRVFNILMLLP